MTDEVKVLSDDALREIEARPSVVIGGPEMVLLTPTERDALCATVRALRAENERLCGWQEGLAATTLAWSEEHVAQIATNTALREQLAQARHLAFRDGRFALMGIHGSTNPDPSHRKGFTAGVNAAIQALEAAAKKEQP